MILEFDTAQIAALAVRTAGQQSQWDSIWEGVRSSIGGTVSAALDECTGASLADRTAAYHAKTQRYLLQLQAQAAATDKIGLIATETNAAMAKAIAG